MDEYEKGQVYNFGGRHFRYTGGAVTDTASWVPVEPDGTPVGGPADSPNSWGSDFARSVAQGGTYGFADELVGLAQGDSAGAASRRRMEQIRQDRPLTALGGELLGGALVPAFSGAAVGADVLGATGSRVLAGVAGGAAGGAIGGALNGAGEAEPGHRLAGATVGGLTGAVVGAGAGAGGAAAGRMVSRMVGAPGDATDWARVQLLHALEDSGLTPEQALAKLREMGPGSVVADLGLPAARKARAASNFAPELSHEGGPIARIGERQAETGERLAGVMRAESGLPGSYQRSLATAEQGVRDVREQGYKALERVKQIRHPAVRQVLLDPRVNAIVAEQSPDVAAGRTPPSFRDLQRAMFRLDDKARAAQTGREFQLADDFRGLKSQLVDAMEQALPKSQIGTFRQTQRAYAIASKAVEAHEMGRQMASQPVGDIVLAMRKLPVQARDGFRQGLLDSWETALGMRTGTGGKAGALIDAGPEVQKRLRVLMGSDPAFKKLMQSRDREWRWRRTFAALAGNSTSLQQAADMFTPDQIPLGRREAFLRAVAWVSGLNGEEKRKAWGMIGRVLLSDGDTAAETLAQELSLRTPVAPAVGAVAGSSAARAVTRRKRPESPMMQTVNPGPDLGPTPGLFQ